MSLPASNDETDVRSMNFAFPTFRALVTAALIVSVAFASVTPAPCNASSLGTVATSCAKPPLSAPKSCCRGTLDCRCGMPCCNSQAPHRSAPAVPATRDDSQSFAWHVSLDCGSLPYADASADKWAATIGTRRVRSDWYSLVALHVQLNT